jgi:hypothetical protein
MIAASCEGDRSENPIHGKIWNCGRSGVLDAFKPRVRGGMDCLASLS